jgi:hypothetical protein
LDVFIFEERMNREPTELLKLLPREILEIIFQYRSTILLKERIKSCNIPWEYFQRVMKATKGILIGDFIFDCLESRKKKSSITIIHQGNVNLFKDLFENNGYDHIHYAESHPCTICFSKFDSRDFVLNREIYVKEKKTFYCYKVNNVDSILKNSFLDINRFHFDGSRFVLDRPIFDWITKGEFKIMDCKNSIYFEMFVDGEFDCMYITSNLANIYDSRKTQGLLEQERMFERIPPRGEFIETFTHLEKNYEAVVLGDLKYAKRSIWNSKKKNFPKLSWINQNDFSKTFDRLVQIICDHYNPKNKQEITKYRIVKSFFEILQTILRGYRCTNLKSFYSENSTIKSISSYAFSLNHFRGLKIIFDPIKRFWIDRFNNFLFFHS